MTIYTDTALKEYLEQTGFCQIQSHKKKKGLAVRYGAKAVKECKEDGAWNEKKQSAVPIG